jgi:uncharacterized protein (DUF2141 family)
VVFIAGLALANQLNGEESGFQIVLTVTGATASQGKIMANLFADESGFMRRPVADLSVAVDDSGTARIDFGDHTPGDYAISVFYDENSNDKLDTGFMGIPREKVGFSNNARGRFGPAKWRDARFLLVDRDLDIDISLKNAKD